MTLPRALYPVWQHPELAAIQGRPPPNATSAHSLRIGQKRHRTGTWRVEKKLRKRSAGLARFDVFVFSVASGGYRFGLLAVVEGESLEGVDEVLLVVFDLVDLHAGQEHVASLDRQPLEHRPLLLYTIGG